MESYLQPDAIYGGQCGAHWYGAFGDSEIHVSSGEINLNWTNYYNRYYSLAGVG